MSKDVEPFLIDIIKTDIDMGPVIKDVQKIIEEYKSAHSEKMDLSKPYSILLSDLESKKTESTIVSYTDVHNKKFFDHPEAAVLHPQYAATSLQGIVEKLPFPFSIFRLSILPPNTIIGMHTDDACHAQLAVVTNEDCFVAARSGETKHVPVDGNLYVISTTLPHTAFNASQHERVHISISIFDDAYIALVKGRLK